MNELSAQPEIIIAVVQHPVLGALLIPYTVQPMSEGRYQLLEQAFHLSPQIKDRLDTVCRAAIDLASLYSEKKLMSVYSKEKTVHAFLKKLKEETLRQVIRPYIEKKLIDMVKLIRMYNLRLYEHKTGTNILYPHHAYKVSPYLTETSFYFEADHASFQYKLTCTRNGEEVSLLNKKPVVTLTTSPATLLIGDELHPFRDINSSRILPFTRKAVVSVDVALLDKYMENVVYPILCHHDIETKGLPVFEEHRPCEAILSIVNNVYEEKSLQLVFAYGDKLFYPGKPFTPKHTFISEEDKRKTIRYFYRDEVKEKTILQQLKESGLWLLSDSSFKLSDNSPCKNITQWIQQNKGILNREVRLLNINRNTEYLLDDIRIEQDFTETNDWFELHITVVVGEFRIPFIQFKKNIIKGNREYILPNGKMILLPDEWFGEYTDLMELSEEHNQELKIKRTYAGVVQHVFNKDGNRTNYQEKEKITPPQALKATLRQYQEDGYNWMLHLRKNNLGGCLADDMGLGKTLQTLAVLQYVYTGGGMFGPTGEDGQLSLFADTGTDEKPRASLVVLPTSLMHNWKREAARFTRLSVYEFLGCNQLKGMAMEQLFNCSNLIITTYGIMRNHIDKLSEYLFEYVVLDESQNIKNSDSLTFKAAIRLRSKHRLVLTGTPIENSLRDLWSQFHFIQPDLFGTEAAYLKQYMNPIKQGNRRIENKLLQLISPFLLRRSKQEVAPELPSLTEEVIYCGMTVSQNEIYQSEKNGLRNLLMNDEADSINRNSLIVLNGITQLRQLASHPAMVQPGYPGDSGKLELIMATYETLRSAGHKVLIFSSFVKHLEIIARALDENGWKYAMLTGGTANREHEINTFSHRSEVGAFLISLKAGGVGLNLTQADYVFIVDPWWNPAAEMQAISRAHRIGQDKQVIAYRFITEDTIEEKIIRLQENKRRLSETFIVDSNPFDALTDTEWEELLR